MNYISILGIAIGLAMDAFAVSMAKSACIKKIKIPIVLRMSVFFGGFQFIMPLLGFFAGNVGDAMIKKVGHYIALILLSYMGLKMIYESRNNNNKKFVTKHQYDNIDTKTLTLLSIATSIDALATGVILPYILHTNNFLDILFASFMVGIVTFFMCFVSVYIGNMFGSILSHKAQAIGGIILIAMGIKIFIENM